MPNFGDQNKICLNTERVLGKTVLAAVSGGADSVALLRLLCAARDTGAIRVSCAHFEHGIRGMDSVGDMEFVRALCARLDVPFFAARADVPGEARKTGEGLETCARRLRRAFLADARAQAGADVIALAHHADDQAETVLMHLLRGGGLRGAVGMREIGGVWWRPLLSYTKSQLLAYLRDIGQTWREDATNFLPDSPRNVLRLEAMPKLNMAYPGCARALTRFARVADAENEYLDECTDRVLAERARGYAGIKIIRLRKGDPLALARRAVQKLMPQLDFENVERALGACRRTPLTGGAFAETFEGELYLSLRFCAPDAVELCPPAPGGARKVYMLSGVCTLTVEPHVGAPIRDDVYRQAVRAEALYGARLRLRETGDFICPLGMGGKTKSLSDYLTDRKLPPPIRDRMPVVARGREILWAAGVGLSESAKMTGDTNNARLTLIINTTIGGEKPCEKT